ncbi:MAG TPA: FMN-dependent NADH-azoreductase [Firmicutes bacterium]|jgi:FMN-dependent NADH-azoreductase|nr:FMN-dependent NADH-azoreductase [Bacillota bacterium]HOQ23298.1 NAD(P)H-dependent oxidoreductase [Bacillota bacterium]HPT66724.1 NAD(P)H-dependent oxidoreductase [Bacillota bacterium]
MAKVLYIKANPKSDQESRTFQISEAFIAAYRQAHPSDEIITLDLYKEMVPPLSTEEVILNNSGTDFAHPFYDYAKQFLAVDKYVFAAPLWNLSVPGILKNYLDRIMVVGITFHYTEEGPVGLCTGKKAVHITSRGSDYSTKPYSDFEMADRYLRALLGFLGVNEFITIAADGLDIDGADVRGIINRAIQEAQAKAKEF